MSFGRDAASAFDCSISWPDVDWLQKDFSSVDEVFSDFFASEKFTTLSHFVVFSICSLEIDINQDFSVHPWKAAIEVSSKKTGERWSGVKSG